MKRVTLVAVILAGLLLAGWLVGPLFFDRMVSEPFPHSSQALIPQKMTRAEVEDRMAVMAALDRRTREPLPEEPMAIAFGSFQGADRFHQGSGAATLYRLQDRTHMLRLDPFKVTNGPDLRVLLTSHPSPAGFDDLREAGFVELDRLKGNIGSQNYLIPPATALDEQKSVVIFCWPFKVVFSTAGLVHGGA